MVKRGMIVVVSLGWSAAMVLLLGVFAGRGSGQDSPAAAPQPGIAATQAVLPCDVGDTGLEAVWLGLYEGLFPEDGSQRPVVDAAALLVKNTLTSPIDRGAVVLRAGEETLVFEVYALPPGQTALVVEARRKAYPGDWVTACDGWAVEARWNSAENSVAVAERGMDALAVTNLTELPVDQVRLLYKSFDPESGVYIGGICHEITVDTIEPGETVVVHPYRYVSGYSQVVAVLAGEATDACF